MANHIERRKFLATLGGAAAWPLAARAQQGERMRRIGVLMSTGERDPETQLRVGAFREGLQKLGWAEGRNLRIDYRWGAGSIELATYAAELVALKPDVIFGAPSAAAVALHRETRTILPAADCFKMLRALAAFDAVENRVLFALMTFGNDQPNRLPHGLLCRIAEYSLRSGIPRRDDTIQVFADDGIIGRFHDRGEARTVAFRVLPRRDIARDLRRTDDDPRFVSDR